MYAERRHRSSDRHFSLSGWRRPHANKHIVSDRFRLDVRHAHGPDPSTSDEHWLHRRFSLHTRSRPWLRSCWVSTSDANQIDEFKGF